MQKSSQVVGWLDLVRFKTFKTRKVFTHVDASTGRNPTQQNYVPSISDIKDLKLSNSTGADIREYLIFHISSCHSRAEVSRLLLENPWGQRDRGLLPSSMQDQQGANWNQLYMCSALGSWGNPSSNQDTLRLLVTFCKKHPARRSRESSSWKEARARGELPGQEPPIAAWKPCGNSDTDVWCSRQSLGDPVTQFQSTFCAIWLPKNLKLSWLSWPEELLDNIEQITAVTNSQGLLFKK